MLLHPYTDLHITMYWHTKMNHKRMEIKFVCRYYCHLIAGNGGEVQDGDNCGVPLLEDHPVDDCDSVHWLCRP